MNWVLLRRIALICASVSFGLLMGLMMVTAGMGEEKGAQGIVMPYNISCTSITVNRLASYDGAFYEDGTGREVMDVATLEIRNNGDKVIPYAHIIVTSGNTQYTFEATMIPPDSLVLVPESNGKPYITEPVETIFGWNTVIPCVKKPNISIQEDGMSSLCVTNQSQDTVQGLTLYYRTYYSEGNVYSGGKAFSLRVPDMKPGETVKLYPEHYVSGYSRIVEYYIRTLERKS